MLSSDNDISDAGNLRSDDPVAVVGMRQASVVAKKEVHQETPLWLSGTFAASI